MKSFFKKSKYIYTKSVLFWFFFLFLWTLIWNKLKYPRVSPVGQVLFPALLVLWVYRHLPKNLPGSSGDWAALETHLEMSKSHLESASKSTKGGFFGCRMVPLWLSHFHCPEGPGQAKLASDLTCWLPFFFFLSLSHWTVVWEGKAQGFIPTLLSLTENTNAPENLVRKWELCPERMDMDTRSR